MKSFPTLIVAIIAIFGLSAASGYATLITVHAGSMRAGAWDGSSGDSRSTLSASFPLDTSDTVTDGIATNTTTYQFDSTGFLITVDHLRGNFGSSNVSSVWVVPLEFSVDQDTPYTISGFYNLSGESRIVLYTRLIDASAGNAVLFRNQQLSVNTPGQAFILGETAGDTSIPAEQFLSGSLTGNLLAGRHYKLEYNFLIQRSTLVGTASATGQVHLRIGSTIPEPASLGLLVLGGVAMFGCRRT